MKYLYLFLLIACTPLLGLTQIVNGNFELWQEIPGNQLKPVGWETNQDTFVHRMRKDTIRTEGNFSLLLDSKSESGWIGCSSTIRQVVTDLPEQLLLGLSLYFDTRLISDDDSDDVYLNASVLYFSNGFTTHIESVEITEANSNYETVELVLADEQLDSISIQFAGSSVDGFVDNCMLYSDVWIDNVRLGQSSGTTHTQENPDLDIVVYPSPSYGYIFIKGQVENVISYKLYNSLGQIVDSGDSIENEIRLPKPGTYFIQLVTEVGTVYTRTISNF